MVEALISGSGGFDYFICQFTLTSLCTAKKVWWISLKTAYYITQNQDLQ